MKVRIKGDDNEGVFEGIDPLYFPANARLRIKTPTDTTTVPMMSTSTPYPFTVDDGAHIRVKRSGKYYRSIHPPPLFPGYDGTKDGIMSDPWVAYTAMSDIASPDYKERDTLPVIMMANFSLYEGIRTQRQFSRAVFLSKYGKQIVPDIELNDVFTSTALNNANVRPAYFLIAQGEIAAFIVVANYGTTSGSNHNWAMGTKAFLINLRTGDYTTVSLPETSATVLTLSPTYANTIFRPFYQHASSVLALYGTSFTDTSSNTYWCRAFGIMYSIDANAFTLRRNISARFETSNNLFVVHNNLQGLCVPLPIRGPNGYTAFGSAIRASNNTYYIWDVDATLRTITMGYRGLGGQYVPTLVRIKGKDMLVGHLRPTNAFSHNVLYYTNGDATFTVTRIDTYTGSDAALLAAKAMLGGTTADDIIVLYATNSRAIVVRRYIAGSTLKLQTFSILDNTLTTLETSLSTVKLSFITRTGGIVRTNTGVFYWIGDNTVAKLPDSVGASVRNCIWGSREVSGASNTTNKVSYPPMPPRTRKIAWLNDPILYWTGTLKGEIIGDEVGDVNNFDTDLKYYNYLNVEFYSIGATSNSQGELTFSLEETVINPPIRNIGWLSERIIYWFRKDDDLE